MRAICLGAPWLAKVGWASSLLPFRDRIVTVAPAARHQDSACLRGAGCLRFFPKLARNGVWEFLTVSVATRLINALTGQVSTSIHLSDYPTNQELCQAFEVWAVSTAAFFPAMRPCTVHLARPCRLNPPALSPAQYRPGITSPEKSTTSHFALIR